MTSTHALTKVTTLNDDDVLRVDLDPANSAVAETERRITGKAFLESIGPGNTDGTGSAGAGKQHVELTIAGVTYKLLHDGIV